jgi:hypothetical protein
VVDAAGFAGAAQVGFDDARIGLHARRRAFGDLLAEVEHGDRVRDRHHDVHVVLDQDDGDAVVADLADDRHQLADVRRRQARGRFVQQQQARVERQRAADLQQALLAVGEVARLFVGQVGQADEIQDRGRPRARRQLLAAVARRVQHGVERGRAEAVVQADQHVFRRRHLAEQLHVLEGAGDAAQRDLRRRAAGDAWPAKTTPPAVGL